jgi:hypothetical protein
MEPEGSLLCSQESFVQVLFRARLVILLFFPIGSLSCVWEPMVTGGSFYPTGEPTGIIYENKNMVLGPDGARHQE